MKDENSEELSVYERELFLKLRNTVSLDSDLEHTIVQRLKHEKLIIKAVSLRKFHIRWAAVLTGLLIMFGGGLYVGHFTRTQETTYNYMLILHQAKNFDTENSVSRFQVYNQWMNDIVEKGTPMTGEKLEMHAQLTSKTSARLIQQDEIYISGFFLVKVNSEEEALAIAQHSPHVQQGGQIEIRKIIHH